jgi:hypothetical protein
MHAAIDKKSVQISRFDSIDVKFVTIEREDSWWMQQPAISGVIPLRLCFESLQNEFFAILNGDAFLINEPFVLSLAIDSVGR